MIGGTHFSGNKSTLLFILSTTCPHCDNNLPSWNLITTRNPNDINTVIGISTQSLTLTKNYYENRDIGFPLVVAADTSFSTKFKIQGVPMTILVNPGGSIGNVWMGELTPTILEEIFATMNAMTAFYN